MEKQEDGIKKRKEETKEKKKKWEKGRDKKRKKEKQKKPSKFTAQQFFITLHKSPYWFSITVIWSRMKNISVIVYHNL